MAKRKGRKHVALFERILDTEPGIKAKFADMDLLQASILDLQCKTPTSLMALYPPLRASEARRLKARLDVAAAAMMRVFREKRLSTGIRRAADEMKGPLALTSGPTFENQFNPSWANHTHPGAVDATTSPAAYLIDMLTFAREHIERQGDADKVLRLETRRPDLFDLSIDETTMNREVTQVEIVNHVMERAIDDHRKAHPQDLASVEDKLLDVRYPFRHFPYETHWEQIRTVLAFNQLHISDFTHLSDIDSPYFIQPGAHSTISNMALQQNSSLGPALRAILLEPSPFRTASVSFNPQTRRLLALPAGNEQQHTARLLETASNFYRINFGVAGYPTLQNVVNFCQALELTQDGMESLFGLSAHAPSLSENAGGSSLPVSPGLFGARFLNSGEEDPVSVESAPDAPEHHRFLNLSEPRCDRLNRLVRLAHALKLSYSETDQVVCAIIDAERHVLAELGRREPEESPLLMTVNTVRGLGLFQYLQARFSCSAEAFAALMSDMGVYAIGDKRSHFDRVFNSDTVTPLVIDGTAFKLSGEDSESKRTIDQLCRGLGINMETFRYLSRLIMQGQGGETLTRSITTFSAFYRVTLLARLLSITTIELLSLLEVLNPEGLYALQLAGDPRNAMYEHFSRTDTVSVTYAVCQCVLWCQEQQLPIAWLVQQLLPIETVDMVPQEFKTLLMELKGDLLPFRNFDQDMAEAGVPGLVSKRWQDVLTNLVDENGLIRATGSSARDFDYLDYENFGQREVNAVIDQLIVDSSGDGIELPGLAVDEVERLKTLVKGVVLRIRVQQWGVVQERLSHVLALNAEKVIPVIYWAEGTVHSLMSSAVGFNPDILAPEPLKAMMPLLLRMKRCAQVATQFDLSPALFSSVLKGSERSRFSLKSTELTLHTLYFLERYTRCLRSARQTEAQLLGYFAAIEAQGELTANEQRLIKDIAADKVATWLGWGIREVLDVAAEVAPDGIIRNLAQLLTLLNTRQLCERTGLSAVSLMKLSRLTAYSDTHAYRSVAQEMLSSLRRDPEQRRDEVELRQSLSSRCEVSESRLIAKKDDGTEATTVSLTLLDMNNQPVSDIRVAWSTDLGKLLDFYSYTDRMGVAQVVLQAGEQQGVAHVKGTYLLDSQAIAPPIMIDCDETTLEVDIIEGKPEAGDLDKLAGGEGVYRFRARLKDIYGNVGIDRLVNWASKIGYFDSTVGETLTDEEGWSTIELRSREAGKGEVAVWYAPLNGDPVVFEVGFEDKAYINSVVLMSWAVEGDDIELEATVLGLNGDPFKFQRITWSCSDPSVEIVADSESGDEGKAGATLKGAIAGELTVTAILTTAEPEPRSYYSKEMSIDVLANASNITYEGDERWPIADGISAGEYAVRVASSDNKPVANYPVVWSVEGGEVETYPMITGPEGIARFALRGTTPGPRTVIATVNDGPPHRFEGVEFMVPLDVAITLKEEAGPDEPIIDKIILIQPQTGKKQYTLTYRLPDDHPLVKLPMQLLYSGRDSDASLGLKFTPPLGSENPVVAGVVRWTIDCENTALRDEVELKFGLWCKQMMKAIERDVVVKPSQG
ncbi:Tc toxin subunit A [Pseudomonas entomophila]|uniref:Ig-like domain-containing protein n=1 Tax=Pseudomonas entomophila TaxID=312306 RepID=UPI002405A693|nr:Tc toxin subunit A [Pseudomonas entomophila]MDF9618198.1 Tc toxin subunit A [Pseudomonas entomophila]